MPILSRACLITLYALLLLLPLPADTLEKQIATHFRAGVEASRSGHFKRAVEEYQAVLRLDSALAEAHANLGLAYHSLGDYTLAVAEFKRALHLKPAIPGASLFLGIDYLKLGYPANAIQPLEAALRSQPSNREARRALAACYVDQDQYRQAAEQFRALSSAEADRAEALYTLGQGYLKLAKHLANLMSRRYQNSAWANRLAGDLLAESLRWADAALLYRQAVMLDPGQPETHASLGKVYLMQGKAEAAEEQLKGALKLDPQDETALFGLAEVYLTRGSAQAALNSIGRVWQVYPPFLSRQPGFPSTKLSAERAHELAVSIEALPDSQARHFLLSALWRLAEEDEKARAQTATFEQDLAAWQKAYRSRSETGSDPCSAHQYSACVDKLLSEKNRSSASNLMLGKAWLALADNSRAADTFAEILSQNTESLPAMYWLARTYKRLADQSFAQLVAQFSDSGRAHEFSGESNQLRDAYDDTIAEYQAAIRLRPADPELHEKLSQVYLERKLFVEADQELQRAVTLDPGRARSLYLLGRSRLSQHQDRESLPYLRRALRIDFSLLEAHAALGQAYMRLKQPERALPELEKAATIDFHGDLHYLLYQAYRSVGKNASAQKALARSTELRHSLIGKHQTRITEMLQEEPH